MVTADGPGRQVTGNPSVAHADTSRYPGSETLGIPLMNSYVSMRLLPYFFADLEGWKRREMREREILDEAPDVH